MQQTFLDGRLIVKTGDITAEPTDAIVNAANSSLLGGGGVDGAIHSKGGPAILAECRRIRATTYSAGLPPGEAVITTAGNLPARYVIHVVGPKYGLNAGHDDELLASAYKNALILAVSEGLKTIAFPSVSTGVYRFPKDRAAAVSARAISEFISKQPTIEEVRLVFFHDSDQQVFLESSGL
ncbi:MAG: O-acetyl-ADP-ribose deacetylase [Pyrinomonadaceae bacterium]